MEGQRARGAQVRRVAWGCSLPCLFVLVLSPLVMLMMRSDRRGFAAGSTVYLISPRASARWRSERETFEKSMRNFSWLPSYYNPGQTHGMKECTLCELSPAVLWHCAVMKLAQVFHSTALERIYCYPVENYFSTAWTALVHKNSSLTPRNLIH